MDGKKRLSLDEKRIQKELETVKRELEELKSKLETREAAEIGQLPFKALEKAGERTAEMVKTATSIMDKALKVANLAANVLREEREKKETE